MDSGNKNYNQFSQFSLKTFSILLFPLLSSIHYVKAQPAPSPDEYQYARFSPSMAIIVVVLVAALFCMGFFSIYIRRCANSDGPGSGGGLSIRRGGRLTAAGSYGLDAGVLETFPTFAYSTVKGLKIGKGALECAVCLNEFEDEETIRLIPKCDHVFHAECIDAWLENHVTCPVCRCNLVPGPRESNELIIQPEMEHNSRNDDNNNQTVMTSQEENCVNSDIMIEISDPNPVFNRVKSAKPPRTKSVRGLILFEKFRSHSTGHSLQSVVQAGENTERFTLRLPEEVRKQVISNALLNRSGSTVRLAGEGSGRQGYRTGEGSSKGKYYRRTGSLERSVFSRAPSILSRAFSVRSQKVPAINGVSSTSDEVPLNNNGTKSDEVRPPV